MKTEFSRLELYALGEPFGASATRNKPGSRGVICGGGGSGGGGGQVKYENLERLYEIQANQGQQLMDMANENVYPAFKELANEARGAGSIANQEKAASTADAAVAGSVGQAKTALSENMASMGVNPADARYSSAMAKLDMDGAAQRAAAQTGARDRQQQLGFAKLKDVTSMGMGIGSDATSALNSAGGFASTGAQMQANQASQDVAARSNIASLAGRMLFKDGGLVKGLPKYAGGGIVGAMGGIKPPAPPVSGPAPRSSGMGFVQGASSAASSGATAGGGKLLARGIEKVGEMSGSNAMQSFGTGLRLGDKAQPAIEAFKSAAPEAAKAAEATTAAVPTAAAPAAAAPAAEAGLAAGATEAGAATAGAAEAGLAAGAAEAGTAAAGGAAAELGVTAGALGAGSAVAAALPWVGGALLIGSALGMFKDGGSVNKKRLAVADHTKGGPVSGPGGPKDDQVPALLSNNEYVMPVGTVKLYGKDTLERMRQEGLAYEKQIGIGSQA